MTLFILAVLATTPQTSNAAQPRRVTSATVEVTVTDRAGVPLKDARVMIDGNSERDGITSALGRLTIYNVKAGSYMLRVERAQYITLEKDFVVRAGIPVTVSASLSSAPPPPPPAPPKPVSGPVGNPRVISIPDFAERQLIGKEAVKESPISCSGAAEARLIQMREPVTTHTHRDADEMLYVVAGEATLKIGEIEQRISAGWFSMVPRGTAHALSRRGRNPVILLSMLSGEPCPVVLARSNAGN
jgi:hypothetical protein